MQLLSMRRLWTSGACLKSYMAPIILSRSVQLLHLLAIIVHKHVQVRTMTIAKGKKIERVGLGTSTVNLEFKTRVRLCLNEAEHYS